MSFYRAPGQLGIFICLTLLFAFYLPCFSGSFFQIDDQSLIHIPLLQSPMGLQFLKALFTPGFHIDYYPIRDLSYWLDIHLLGADPQGFSTMIFKIHNFGLFFALCFIVYTLLRQLAVGELAATLITLLWVCDPIHSELILWPSARKDLLALFYFALAALLGIESDKKNIAYLIVAAVLCFLLSLLSKASFALFPAALLFGSWAGAFRIRAHRTKVAITIATLLGLGCSLVQSWFYGHVHDMRFFYSEAYRLRASVTALGRMLVGLGVPTVNAVDVENWGNWSGLNVSFFKWGCVFWVIYFVALGLCLMRRNRTVGFVLAVFICLYFPVSGLIFAHRNFYSVRYIEAPFLACWVVGFASLSRSTKWKSFVQYRNSYVTLGCVIGIVYFLVCSRFEARAWMSEEAPFEKALTITPENPALQARLLREIRILDSWGKASHEQLRHAQDLKNRLKNRCDLPFFSGRNGDLCFECWWSECWLDPESHRARARTSAALAIATLETLNPKRGEIELSDMLFLQTLKRRPLSYSDIDRWRSLHPFKYRPLYVNLDLISECFLKGTSQARSLLAQYRSEYRVDLGELESLACIGMKKSSSQQKLNDCFDCRQLGFPARRIKDLTRFVGNI